MAESILGIVIGELMDYLDQIVGIEGIVPFLPEKLEVGDLKQEMVFIQSRLANAEKQLESENLNTDIPRVRDELLRLKCALFRLEDLLEEVVVAMKGSKKKTPAGAKLKQLINNQLLSFSCSKALKIDMSIAQEAEAIMSQVKAVSWYMGRFDPVVSSVSPTRSNVSQLVLTLSKETRPLLSEEKLIGRDGDRRRIKEMILRPSDAGEQSGVFVIPIIGICGSGKTALARAIFGDEHVQQNFEVKGWACVSHVSGLKDLLWTILKSITGWDCCQLSLAKLKSCLQDAVMDKKYLLVLDGVRDKHCDEWLHLSSLLNEGTSGSRVLLTTRSRSVAQNGGTVEPYELGGLQDEDAWALFRCLAFKEGHEEELASLGKKIVGQCQNVPLAIRIIAPLVYCKDSRQEWEHFSNTELQMVIERRDEEREDLMDSKITMIQGVEGDEDREDFKLNEHRKKEQDEQRMLSTFRLSYNHLPANLKMCFIYCSVFPKNYELNKQELIYFWMAQGFIKPSMGSHPQKQEDVGDSYFIELLRRCFFKDVRTNEYGEIISCKMHDLAHDLAQLEASFECCTPQNHGKALLHASFMVESSWEPPSWWNNTQHLRSLVFLPRKLQLFTIRDVDQTLLGLRYLRTLDLIWANCESLPNSIGVLKHLRYLRLGGALVSLPKCIDRLVNLQTLDVRACHQLRRLPTSLNQLVKLRHFLSRGTLIDDMPPEFERLTSLQTLDLFVVGNNNGLDVLDKLNGLDGDLEIHFKKHHVEVKSDYTCYIRSKNLTSLILEWSCSNEEELMVDAVKEKITDMELKCLRPSLSLKSLKVSHWKGIEFPTWVIQLCNLVSIKIKGCSRCQHLPALSQLPNLKSVELANLDSLECIELGGGYNRMVSKETIFFPSLEELKLVYLLRLKAWSSEEQEIGRQEKHEIDHWMPPPFPRLSQLTLRGCPKLMSMPWVPQLQSLSATRIQKKLLQQLIAAQKSPAAAVSSPSPTPSLRLSIESVYELDSLSINIISIESLTITECQELTKLTVTYASFLQCLEIRSCRRLIDISEALQHLSGLNKLVIHDCQDINWDKSQAQEAWQGLKSLCCLELKRVLKLKLLPQCLSSLTTLEDLHISGLPNLTALPEYVDSFVRLRRLNIQDCPKLTAIPEQIGKLTQLRQLHVQHCPLLMSLPKSLSQLTGLQKLWISECHPELGRRCKKPDGEDWPLIRNVRLASVHW